MWLHCVVDTPLPRIDTTVPQAATTESELRADLEKAAKLAEQQMEVTEELAASNRDATTEREVLQRSMIGLSVDVESAREKLTSALRQANGRRGGRRGDRSGSDGKWECTLCVFASLSS